MSENNANCHKRECPLYDECWLCDGEQTCIDRLSDYQQGRADAIESYKWISVDVQMPSDIGEDWVLVCVFDDDFRCIPTVAEYRKGHWWGHSFCTEDDCIDGEDSPFKVKYWKPIFDEFQLAYLEQIKEQKNGD